MIINQQTKDDAFIDLMKQLISDKKTRMQLMNAFPGTITDGILQINEHDRLILEKISHSRLINPKAKFNEKLVLCSSSGF